MGIQMAPRSAPLKTFRVELIDNLNHALFNLLVKFSILNRVHAFLASEIKVPICNVLKSPKLVGPLSTIIDASPQMDFKIYEIPNRLCQIT